jgi:hypothetical protein
MRAAVNDTNQGVSERIAAWVITGPVGHFASAAADWAVFLWRTRKRQKSPR